MKEEGIHEGCIEQIQRLYQDRLFLVQMLPRMKIRIIDLEMRPDVQEKSSKVVERSGYEIYRYQIWKGIEGFYNLFGFAVEGVDYKADTDEMVNVPSIV
jgi:enoyl-[acyl-carrier protein] reductase/trans-2-enoyl-CoA reductase (NAD+)